MVNRLVLENLKHRPVRTLLSALAIGVQVTMVLTLVGVSRGMLNDIAARSRATGADIIIRPPGSSVIGFGANMPAAMLDFVRQQPNVVLATGTLVQPLGNIDSITGVNLAEFDKMAGGLVYRDGGPFTGGDEVVIDEVYARAKKLRVGDMLNLGNPWKVTGIVEPGKLSRVFAPLAVLQEKYSATNKLTVVYAKLNDPARTGEMIALLKGKLPEHQIYSVEEFTSLISIDNIPLLRQFIGVVIGIGVLVGFLVVFLSMYTAVLERTREIGILKALGASPFYILNILLRETAVLAAAGTALGIVMSYGTRSAMTVLAPTMQQAIVPDWWPYAALIALGGALVGAFYPGLKAARQDAIEALAYE